MNIDEVNNRISAIFRRQGLDPAAEAERRKAESMTKGESEQMIDATVRIDPAEKTEEQPAPPPQEVASSVPLMMAGDVIIPEGAAGAQIPMLKARFIAAWVYGVNQRTPGQIVQPTLEDWNAWLDEDSKPENHPPSPLAHLIAVSDETWQDIRARSNWNRPPSAPLPEPRLGNTFGTDRTARFGRER
jgi:hypothetical protein